MQATSPILLGLALTLGAGPARPTAPDVARLREMLHDRQHSRSQSQAALLLVQCNAPEAEKLVRRELRRAEDAQVFQALAEAVRLQLDDRFHNELLAALALNRAGVRPTAAETLAILADAALVRRLRLLACDARATVPTREAALYALGRCGRKDAVLALLEALDSPVEAVRDTAADALADIAGEELGTDPTRWRRWWEAHKNLPAERWLQLRLAYQTARAQHLEGDLGRTRVQVLRLQQQLHCRLSPGERLTHIESLLDQEDPAVRNLSVSWSLEMLPAAEADQKRTLTRVLLRLSQDGAPEVQRAAVLALGRVSDPAAFERLRELARPGQPWVRAAAVRSLAQQARGSDASALARQRQAVPALQKALDDPAVEVVVEAAEALGSLGTLEAGPVLTNLLHHPSEHVRQTAAQALERAAGPSVLDGLLKALDDPSVAVRFGLVGAVAHAAGDGRTLATAQRTRVLARLEALLRDSDPGVRNRAATVLGECGTPALLAPLWQCVLAGEDGRVQEKAWTALVEIVARSKNFELLREWDHKLAAAGQGPRRLQLLGEASARWQKDPEARTAAGHALETLVQVQLELGKWSAAAPLVRDLLTSPGGEAAMDQRLRWLLAIGEQALREGNRAEAMRAVQVAQPYLSRGGKLARSFDALAKKARSGG